MNSSNGVDMDRFDYILRDNYYVEIMIAFDYVDRVEIITSSRENNQPRSDYEEWNGREYRYTHYPYLELDLLWWGSGV